MPTTRPGSRGPEAFTLHVYDEGQHLRHPQMSGLPLPRSPCPHRSNEPFLIGPGFAADAVLRGRVFSAEEALRIGWLDAVLPVDGFVDAAVAWCQEMADLPSAGLFAAKRVLVQGLELSLE